MGDAMAPFGVRWAALPPALDRDGLLLDESAPEGVLARGLARNALQPDQSRWNGSDIKELPPAPSSAKLFLSAMLSVGAWHVVRSARNLHFGALPEWYHEAAPAQIGHAVPFNLDLSLSALPLCRFERPAGLRPTFERVARSFDFRRDHQCFLTVVDPRGPPSCV